VSIPSYINLFRKNIDETASDNMNSVASPSCASINMNLSRSSIILKRIEYEKIRWSPRSNDTVRLRRHMKQIYGENTDSRID
jgi:hypothetical protein